MCATWRAAVLSLAPFWSHRRFALPLRWHANGRPFSWNPERRVGWLRVVEAPSARDGAVSSIGGAPEREHEIQAGPARGVCRCIPPRAHDVSAVHQRVGLLYSYLVQRRTDAGCVVVTLPGRIPSSLLGHPCWNMSIFGRIISISLLAQTQSMLR
jgi:hypothetical protein